MGEDQVLYGEDSEQDLIDMQDWVDMFVADAVGEVMDPADLADKLVEYMRTRGWKTWTYFKPDGTRDFELKSKY